MSDWLVCDECGTEAPAGAAGWATALRASLEDLTVVPIKLCPGCAAELEALAKANDADEEGSE